MAATEAVSIQILVPLAGRERWELRVPVEPGETIPQVLSRLGEPLSGELGRKLRPGAEDAYGVFVDEKLLRPGELAECQLRGGEKITVFALLIGG